MQKHCRNFESAEYGARTLQTTDRQTHGWTTTYSEHEHEFTFAKKHRPLTFHPFVGVILLNRSTCHFFVLSGVSDVITHAKFCVNRLRGFSVTAPQKCHFQYFIERPLQQFCTTVQTVMQYRAVSLREGSCIALYEHSNYLNSNAGTVVPLPECFKDDNASQWKSGKFDPRSLRNP